MMDGPTDWLFLESSYGSSVQSLPNEFALDRLGEGIERRIQPLVDRISDVDGFTCRVNGYGFCGKLN